MREREGPHTADATAHAARHANATPRRASTRHRSGYPARLPCSALLTCVLLTAPLAWGQEPPATLPQDPGEVRTLLAAPAQRTVIPAYAPALRMEYRRYTAPRPLRLWIAEVDLRHPEIGFRLTAPRTFDGENAGFETACETTLGFAERSGSSLAINTSAFRPFRARSGLPMDVVGLAARDGQRYSDPQAPFGAMYIGRDATVRLKAPPLPTDELWHVVPGFSMLLDDRRIVVDPVRASSNFGGVNPRTAVGTSQDGRRLWIVVADGRQPDVSMGMTLVELAVLFETLGAWDALNLDGGGSSTLVLRDADGTHRVVNTPVGNRAPDTLRQVANNLGLVLPGRGPRADDLPRPGDD